MLGLFAALAFVLGLGALVLWLLKRLGRLGASPRARVPVEVVQRVPLGAKTALAVVRVGEKVMAVSVGEGGVRPLFELDDADRERVLATSRVPEPMTSSPAATAAFTSVLGAALGGALGAESGAGTGSAAHRDAPRAADAARSPTTPRGGGDLRTVLGISLSGATRLAAFVGACVVGGAVALPLSVPLVTRLGAQAAPAATAAPVALPPGTPVATRPAAPTPPPAPARPQAAGTPGAAPGAAPAATSALPSTGPSAPQPTTPPPARSTAQGGRAPAAQAAPVAGGEEALARLVPQMDISLGGGQEGGLRLSGTVGIVVMMGLLTLLPTLLLMMTGFTRILIVLHFLKQAMGTQSAPPGQLIAALALLLTGFVMGPTLREVNRTAITPWLDGRITQVEMLKTGAQPMRDFMLRQTRAEDLKAFIEMSRLERPETPDDVPLHVLMSAFVASELRTAFQIGFAIYLPFIVIDAVVASVLMSMGMFMLPPAMISLPFKLLLFVLVDGWSLTITSLVQSFR
jgi:flagellar biosynthetic protein FliP